MSVADAGVPLIEVSRGGCVESVHLGAIAVVDAAGDLKWSAGNPSVLSFPRSALKPLQVLALVARGGTQRFGFEPDEVAVMAGSHGGEPIHVERVMRILARIDAPMSALECGVQRPLDAAAAAALDAAGVQPTALHNNCSGKHAGMLALARLLGAPLEGYIRPEHPAQVAIRECLLDLVQLDPAALVIGMDGCSAPAYALPLERMARAFALLADPAQAPERWQATLSVVGRAMRRYPELVGATHGRIDTELMRLERVLIAKSGAEGYFCVAHTAGVGLAIKILDGDPVGRARNLATAMAVRCLGRIGDEDLSGPLRAFGPQVPIKNLAGRQTGEIRPADVLLPSTS